MKKKSSITFGPGAASLILIFVILALSVLGMLSLMNSRNDKVLSQRSASVTESVYALNARAESTRMLLDELLWRLIPEADSDETYLSALALALQAASEFDADTEYASVAGLFDVVSQHEADGQAFIGAVSALTAFSEDRSEFSDFATAMTALGSVTIADDVLSWVETDGFRTLDCELQVNALGSEVRAHWIKHDLTAETAEAW